MSTAPTGPPGSQALPGQRLLSLITDAEQWTRSRPWVLPALVVVGLGLIAGWQGARGAVARWRLLRAATHAQQVIILPPPVVEPGGATMWWANLAGLLRPALWRRLVYGAAHIAMEYRWAGRHLQIVVWVPGTVAAGPVAAAARAAWPGAFTRIEDATSPLQAPHLSGSAPPPAAGRTGGQRLGGQRPGGTVVVRQEGAALVAALPTWYPLAVRTAQESDPLRALISAGADLHTGEAACVQILARLAGHRRVARARTWAAAAASGQGAPATIGQQLLSGALEGVTGLLTTTGRPTRPLTGPARPGVQTVGGREARAGAEKLTGTQWEIAIRIGLTHTSPSRTARPAGTGHRPPWRLPLARERGAGTRVARDGDGVGRRLSVLTHQFTSALAVHDAANRLRRIRLRNPATVMGSRSMRAGFLVSGPELCALAGLPSDVSVPGLDRARAKSVPAPITVPGGGRNTKILGRTQAGGHSVALPVVDARRHVHVLGSTGAGKSTLLTHMILDDIRAGRPTVLIDPKGDLALDVLDRLPVSAAPRLVLIDPDQEIGSATFNPLELRPGADADLIVDNIVSIFSAIFQRHWGPRIDDVLRVSCLTLMRYPNPNLLNVPPLLNSKQFRAPFTVGFDDPAGLKGFWEWYESAPPALKAQVIGPVLARLRSFLLRDFVRSTVGATRSSFDMRKVLNGRGILIARLPKGQLGEDTSRLLGSLIFASVWQAATARAAVPEAQRRDASVYVDEAHNILNLATTVDGMLAESRGYHLSMVLAHQHLAQLPRETVLALSANAGNKIFFSCSPEDARQLARHTLPELDEHDVSHLDAYIAAARLVINNRETAAFTLATNPPTPVTGQLAQLRAAIAATAAPIQPSHPLETGPPHDPTTTAQSGPGETKEGPDVSAPPGETAAAPSNRRPPRPAGRSSTNGPRKAATQARPGPAAHHRAPQPGDPVSEEPNQ